MSSSSPAKGKRANRGKRKQAELQGERSERSPPEWLLKWRDKDAAIGALASAVRPNYWLYHSMDVDERYLWQSDSDWIVNVPHEDEGEDVDLSTASNEHESERGSATSMSDAVESVKASAGNAEGVVDVSSTPYSKFFSIPALDSVATIKQEGRRLAECSGPNCIIGDDSTNVASNTLETIKATETRSEIDSSKMRDVSNTPYSKFFAISESNLSAATSKQEANDLFKSSAPNAVDGVDDRKNESAPDLKSAKIRSEHIMSSAQSEPEIGILSNAAQSDDALLSKFIDSQPGNVIEDGDAELARKLQEEEDNAAKEFFRKLAEEDERLAAQLAMDESSTPALDPDSVHFEQMMREIEKSKQPLGNPRDLAKELIVSTPVDLPLETEEEEDDDDPQVQDLQNGSADMQEFRQNIQYAEIMEKLERETREAEEADAQFARRLQWEEELARYADDSEDLEASKRLAQQLLEEELGHEEEDAMMAQFLQQKYDEASDREYAYLLSQPHGNEVLQLRSIYPSLPVERCFEILERVNYDLTEACRLVDEFPPMRETLPSRQQSIDADRKSFGAATRPQHSYPIQVLVVRLVDKCGILIPEEAIRQAAEDANGDEERAETLLTHRFPKEMFSIGLHRRCSKAYAPSNTNPESTSAWGPRVTKMSGENLSTYDTGLNDQIDPYYLELVGREYTMNDLIAACHRFGGEASGSNRDGRPVNVQLQHRVLFDGLRNQSERHQAELLRFRRLQARANLEGRFDEAREWKKRFDRLVQMSMAANQEAADILFVQKNPSLVQRIFGSPYDNNDDNTVSVDLHLLTRQEARDRALALIHLAVAKKWRTLKIITGKGIHSRQQTSVVKEEIISLLERCRGSLISSFVDQGGSCVVKVRQTKKPY